MKEKINIREYINQDKASLLNLLRLNTPDFFSPDEEKDLVYYLDNEIEKYFVVEIGSEIVGCGGINFENDYTIGKISWDILHPEYHGKGIGSQLLKHRIEVIESIKSIQNISVRTSQMAYKFYEKNGFRLKRVVEDYWAKGFDLYEMEMFPKK